MKPSLIPLLLLALAPVPARSERGVEPSVLQPFRISETGGSGSPAIAYNTTANEYLIVWDSPDPSSGTLRVFGQRIDAATGSGVGTNDFAISGNDADARGPAVAYNSGLDEFLVVWSSGGRYVGRRVDAGGSPLGVEFTAGSGTGAAPALAYNATTGEYLMTFPFFIGFRYCETWFPDFCMRWITGTHQSITAVRLDGGGVTLGATVAVAASTFGSMTGPILFAESDVVWNSVDNEYLIVYTLYQAAYAVRMDGNSGARIGQWLKVGASANGRPRAVHNANRNEYLVVWERTQDGRPQAFGQLLTSTGIETGPDDFLISNAPSTYSGRSPDVAHDGYRDEYLVVWNGELVDDGERVFAQRLSATGSEIGVNDLTITGAGYGAAMPTVAHNPSVREHLIAWAGMAPSVSATEIFGARFGPTNRFVMGLGSGGRGESQPWQLTSSGFAAQAPIDLPWPYYNDVNGEVHPALGDIDGDGLNEVILGPGRYGDGWIAIFDDAEHGHALLSWVQLPWPSYNASNGTIWPAVGDIDGDGKAEIVAGLGNGGGGYYAIFDDAAHGHALLTWRRVNWSWYNTTQSGETRPAVANMDGGSFSEIVIGLGPGGAGWLEVVDDADAGYAHLRWLRVGWGAYNSGPGETFPAAGDVDGDGYDEIVVGLGPNSQGWLQVFDDAFQGLVHKGWLQVSWSAYANTNGETHPAVGDIDGDAAHEIVLGLGVFPGQGGWFEVRDDFPSSFISLGWRNVGRGDFYAAGGATFPAASRR